MTFESSLIQKRLCLASSDIGTICANIFHTWLFSESCMNESLHDKHAIYKNTLNYFLLSSITVSVTKLLSDVHGKSYYMYVY